MNSSMTIALDLAKTVFEIAIADSHWRIVERHPPAQPLAVPAVLLQSRPNDGRDRGLGHRPFLGSMADRPRFYGSIDPGALRAPYRRRNKNDAADAAALVEAARCAEIIDVPMKSVEQQAIQGLHRILYSGRILDALADDS